MKVIKGFLIATIIFLIGRVPAHSCDQRVPAHSCDQQVQTQDQLAFEATPPSSPLQCGFNSRDPASVRRGLQIVKDSGSISPEIIAIYNKQMREQNDDNNKQALNKTVEQILPQDLPPTNDKNAVLSKIADRSLEKYFNREDVRNSLLGKTAHRIEQSVQQEVSIKSSHSIEHKINFNMQLFQGIAKIDYSGITSARLYYQFQKATSGLELFKSLPKGKELAVSHISKNNEGTISSMILRWSW